MSRLSDNFTLSEFTNSQAAARLGIDNTADPHIITSLTKLCLNVLEPIRKHYGKPVRISSGYRSFSLNAAIGGSKNSQHTLGEAADIEIAGVSNSDLWKWIQANCTFDQLIAEYLKKNDPAAGWVHVSYREGRNRGQAISCVGGKYISGLHLV